MSVKVHEAVCLDSAQDRYFWFDHFLGDQLKDEWDTTGGAGGSAVVVDQQTGGIVRITTDGDNGDAYEIDWNDIRSLLISKKVTMEFRLKLNQTADILVIALLQYDANNRVGFWFNAAADTEWKIYSEDGGAITDPDSGETPDTDYHVFRIECFPTGQVHFYIDGVETSNSPITTNIPDDATDYLQPRFYIITQADAEKSMDIDYVVVRQER